MAWERSFEKKILKFHDKELKYQKLKYVIKVLRLCDLNLFYPHICLTKRSRIKSSEFYVGMDPTKLTQSKMTIHMIGVVYPSCFFYAHVLPPPYYTVLRSVKVPVTYRTSLRRNWGGMGMDRRMAIATCLGL